MKINENLSCLFHITDIRICRSVTNTVHYSTRCLIDDSDCLQALAKSSFNIAWFCFCYICPKGSTSTDGFQGAWTVHKNTKGYKSCKYKHGSLKVFMTMNKLYLHFDPSSSTLLIILAILIRKTFRMFIQFKARKN